jgi:hypothetical protein
MTVICDDALTAMRSMQDASFDLIILDPDYNDWSQLLRDGLLEESLRLLAARGNIVCFTKQPFDFDLRVAVEPYLRRQIVWSFSNGGAWCSKSLPLISHQLLFWCSADKLPFFEPRTGMEYSDATRAFTRGRKVFGGYNESGREFTPSDDGTWMRDHLHINKPLSGQVFEKPRDLLTILIRCLSPVGARVLDPFAGSGAIMKTAADLERSCVSVERDPTRVRAIEDYLSGRLFT